MYISDSDSSLASSVCDYDHAREPASDVEIDVNDIKDFFDAEEPLYKGNLKPLEYYRRALEPCNEGNPYAEVDYSDASTTLLNSVEKKWISWVHLPKHSY